MKPLVSVSLQALPTATGREARIKYCHSCNKRLYLFYSCCKKLQPKVESFWKCWTTISQTFILRWQDTSSKNIFQRGEKEHNQRNGNHSSQSVWVDQAHLLSLLSKERIEYWVRHRRIGQSRGSHDDGGRAQRDGGWWKIGWIRRTWGSDYEEKPPTAQKSPYLEWPCEEWRYFVIYLHGNKLHSTKPTQAWVTTSTLRP